MAESTFQTIIIIGAGGHAKVLIDALKLLERRSREYPSTKCSRYL